MRYVFVHLAVLAALSQVVLAGQDDDFAGMVRKFSAERHGLADQLVRDLSIPPPAGMKAFFEAAEGGEWLGVSNRFNAFLRTGEPKDGVKPEVQNALWSPILETLGVYEVLVEWKRDSALLKLLYEPILSSMPTGSIYLGGTDYGRFVITAVNALGPASNVYCITQNALADSSYMAHLRAVYGKNLSMPGQEECSGAFGRYLEDLRSGRRPADSGVKIGDGRVTVAGVQSIMIINGMICEMIFEQNKDEHAFFVEESYVIDWMYPYLEPHGLIMKLNARPLDKLDDGVVQRDQLFWREHVEKLRRHPGFNDNTEARKAFAKLRCAIAGIYAYRHRYEDAEAAFTQAMDLCPVCPEATFRLARMHEEQGKKDSAIAVIRKYIELEANTLARYGDINALYTQDKARDYMHELEGK